MAIFKNFDYDIIEDGNSLLFNCIVLTSFQDKDEAYDALMDMEADYVKQQEDDMISEF